MPDSNESVGSSKSVFLLKNATFEPQVARLTPGAKNGTFLPRNGHLKWIKRGMIRPGVFLVFFISFLIKNYIKLIIFWLVDIL